MHIYFSGIGGVGIGPAALIAKQAGYDVSGSDMRGSQMIDDLRRQGIDIHIGQKASQIAEVNSKMQIDWFVHSSAISEDSEELQLCRENGIKTSKRDDFINEILSQKHLKLVAIAGTHGKTTTTGMVVWLFKQLGLPVSYSLGAKVGDYDMSEYDPKSEYFIYECDEFDRNFLAFKPFVSIISGLGYDHHEIYPTRDDYNQAFRDFLNQSQSIVMWQQDLEILNKSSISTEVRAEQEDNPTLDAIKLPGLYNRHDAWLAIRAMRALTDSPLEQLIDSINKFPGVSRRFEEIVPNLFSDDAHTPEKIVGAMSVAKESAKPEQKIVVIYEPLTNRRMHYTAKEHHSVFEGASAVYWVPSYLAREDSSQKILTPAELIENLSPEMKKIAEPADRDERLKEDIAAHLQNGDMVLGLSGGSADSLDDWLRNEFGP